MVLKVDGSEQFVCKIVVSASFAVSRVPAIYANLHYGFCC